MNSYIITSDRLSQPRGTVLTAGELDDLGVNVAALIEAGHLSPHEQKKSTKHNINDLEK